MSDTGQNAGEPQIALQLYTVRSLASQDLLGTLRAASRQGFRAVEFAGFWGVPVEQIRTELDRMGMRAISAHMPLQELHASADSALNTARTLGCSYVVVPYVTEDRRSPDQARALAEELNRFGEMCRDAGFRLAYHNHNFEFAQPDGTGATMFDVLVERTDPKVVGFELDVYWARYAGREPAELIRQLAGRIPLLHAKDMSPGEDRADVPPGEGILPWSDILGASRDAGVEWYMVELDNPRDPLADAETGLRNLRRMLQEIDAGS